MCQTENATQSFSKLGNIINNMNIKSSIQWNYQIDALGLST